MARLVAHTVNFQEKARQEAEAREAAASAQAQAEAERQKKLADEQQNTAAVAGQRAGLKCVTWQTRKLLWLSLL